MIYISSDHAGYQLKKTLTRKMQTILRLKFRDLGPNTYVLDDDFPDFAIPLARKVAKSKNDRGILICGSGHGMCITANKIKGIRAALCSSIESAAMAKAEENANVLCLSSRTLTDDHALAIIKAFMQTKFDKKKKRVRRLKKISAIE